MLSKTRSGKLYKIDYPNFDNVSRKSESELAIKSFHNEEISQFCYDSEESLSMENKDDKSVNDEIIYLNNKDSTSFHYDDNDIINQEFESDHNVDQIQNKSNNSSVLTKEQIARIKQNREVALIKLYENQCKYNTPQLLSDHNKKPLSDEQRERIEQNRKQALQKRNTSLSIKSNIIHDSFSKVRKS